MTDIIITGLIAGLIAFLALFIISFFILGVITGVIHLVTTVYRNLVFGKAPAYEEQTV